MKPKIYIAGPMRGYKNYNFPAFDLAETGLQRGWHVISPAAMDRLFEGWGKYPPEDSAFITGDLKRFIRRDLNLLLEFSPENEDAIYMLIGWESSKGARLEYALAEFLGLMILFESGNG